MLKMLISGRQETGDRRQETEDWRLKTEERRLLTAVWHVNLARDLHQFMIDRGPKTS